MFIFSYMKVLNMLQAGFIFSLSGSIIYISLDDYLNKKRRIYKYPYELNDLTINHFLNPGLYLGFVGILVSYYKDRLCLSK